MTKPLTLTLLILLFSSVLNDNVNAAAAVAVAVVDPATQDVEYQKYLKEYQTNHQLLTNEIFEKFFINCGSTSGKGLAKIMANYILPFCTYDQWLKGIKLIDAISKGQLEEAKKLIESRAFVNARDNYDSTPLIWAARYGNTENDGFTPLIYAARYGHTNIIKLIIKLLRKAPSSNSNSKCIVS